MSKSFGVWLKQQSNRDEPIGDLATDFITWCKFKQRKPSQFKTADDFHEACSWQFCSAAEDAFEEASDEFAAFVHSGSQG